MNSLLERLLQAKTHEQRVAFMQEVMSMQDELTEPDIIAALLDMSIHHVDNMNAGISKTPTWENLFFSTHIHDELELIKDKDALFYLAFSIALILTALSKEKEDANI